LKRGDPFLIEAAWRLIAPVPPEKQSEGIPITILSAQDRNALVRFLEEFSIFPKRKSWGSQ
jgi:hypothetical protein